MRKPIAVVAIAGLAFLVAAPQASAQKATEIYIPIGKSPGLSGKYTVIGHISAVSAADHTITVTSPSKTWTGKLDDKTRVYLDRSAVHEKNLYGTRADCCEGVLVEMKYAGAPGETTTVEWIKVKVKATR